MSTWTKSPIGREVRQIVRGEVDAPIRDEELQRRRQERPQCCGDLGGGDPGARDEQGLPQTLAGAGIGEHQHGDPGAHAGLLVPLLPQRQALLSSGGIFLLALLPCGPLLRPQTPPLHRIGRRTLLVRRSHPPSVGVQHLPHLSWLGSSSVVES